MNLADDIRPQVQSSLGEAYTIERELGGGGMSRTYVAMERSLSRRVVVKVLSPELAAGVSVERFKREILLAAQMQHPHVVPVLSSGDASGLPWFTMPFVEGESLRTRLSRGPLPTGEAVSVLRDVARALAFAHGRGVVHRDIKPDNVLLSEGSATVTDFGIAKAISAARTGGGGETLTMAGTSIGTPAYMAPEQAAGDPNIDHRSDIYAFGCMAYEVLTGRPPFTGQSPAKLLGAHLGEKPRDVRELRADTPESLAALVMQSLEKDPAARPQMASDLVRVLDTVTSSGTASAAPGILAGRIPIGKAIAFWALGAAIVGLTAWAATVVIGLPDWVLPGSIGVMLAGLPIIGFTAWVQRVAHRTYTATPTFTPGGTFTAPQGTLHTLAIKASPHVSWKRTWMGGAVAVGAFVVLVVGWMVMRALGIGPAGSLIGAGKLGAGDHIILVDFASPASDSSLGVTVTEALRADLSESSILRVLPRLATIEVLRLMRRPTDSRIDFELARTIATREGLKAVLDGDIVSLGGRYVLTTRLVSATGDQLATFSETAASDNDLIPAIGRLGKQIRTRAGESLKLVREAGALDRVTTGSLEALRKYTAANVAFDQTADYARAIPLLKEAVDIDSTFAMAWRRLTSYYSNTGRRELAREAASMAYRFADRLGENERQLTIATYYLAGPELDDEKALTAYETLLARDSLNSTALNNASTLLTRRGENEKAIDYYLRSAALPGRTPLSFDNALRTSVNLGRWTVVDSILSEFGKAYPSNPLVQTWPSLIAAVRGEFDRASQLSTAALPRVASSRTAVINLRGMDAQVSAIRGKIRESLGYRREQRERQMQAGGSTARLDVVLDSVSLTAVVLEQRERARRMLDQSLLRVPVESIAAIDRNYTLLMSIASQVGDVARAKKWHAESRVVHEAYGRPFDRPARESYEDAMLAMAEGRNRDALASLERSEAQKLPRTDVLGAAKFLVLDRLQLADSAIGAGEAYLTLTHQLRSSQDALYLAGIRQRLGELYESKGDFDKALLHYTAFVELWKDADPELQLRVRDVRSRIERIQRRRG
jgi:tetratricopeptide (TPR) repeat protein